MIRASSVFTSIITGLLISFFAHSEIRANTNPHGDIKWDCEACHTPAGWERLKEALDFSHSETGFPLTGAHSDAECRNCHTKLTFAHIAAECVDCHTDIHREQFGIECQQCHTPTDWHRSRL